MIMIIQVSINSSVPLGTSAMGLVTKALGEGLSITNQTQKQSSLGDVGFFSNKTSRSKAFNPH